MNLSYGEKSVDDHRSHHHDQPHLPLSFLHLLKVLIDKPSNASEVFEHLSSEVKEARVAPADTTPSLGRQAATASQLHWAQTCKKLFVIPDEPPEAGPIVPDMLDEANMWDWAGVSFGRLETYRLYLSVKKVKTRFVVR